MRSLGCSICLLALREGGRSMHLGCRICPVCIDTDTVEIHATTTTPPIGWRAREKAVYKLIRRAIRKSQGKIGAPNSPHSLCWTVSLDSLQIDEWVRKLEIRANAILLAPLSSRRVQFILGITSHELLRWYKDGRLPACGRITTGRQAGNFSQPVFPADRIAELSETPEIVEQWRRFDQEIEQAPRAPTDQFEPTGSKSGCSSDSPGQAQAIPYDIKKSLCGH